MIRNHLVLTEPSLRSLSFTTRGMMCLFITFFSSAMGIVSTFLGNLLKALSSGEKIVICCCKRLVVIPARLAALLNVSKDLP